MPPINRTQAYNYSYFILYTEVHATCTENQTLPKLTAPHKSLGTSALEALWYGSAQPTMKPTALKND